MDRHRDVETSDGRVVGYFTPTKARMLKLDPPELPPGELDRREASGSGRPLKDILRDLEARGEGESGVTVPAN